MMSKEEIGKEIRQSNIWIAILLFLSALNIGYTIFNIVTQVSLWLILFNIAAAIFPAYVAYRQIMIKRGWKRILWDVESLEKLKEN